MNREDIIRMAREAGLGRYLWLDNEFVSGIGAMYQVTDETVVEMMERFAALVAAHEREACAKLCENMETHRFENYIGRDFAHAIRARGNV